MDALQSIPVVGPILPLLLGAAALWFAYSWLAPQLKLPSLDFGAITARLTGGGSETARLMRQANKEKRAGNILLAGKLLEDAGAPQQALELYLGNEEWAAAGFVYEQMPGRGEKAADMFLKAGDWKKAAQVYEKSGKPAKAAALYQEKGNNLDAARLYAAAEDWAKSAELYLKSGYPLKAGESFEKQGDALHAAECYERHFMENVAFATTYSSTAASADTKYAQSAGRLYESAGMLEKAHEIYGRGGFFAEAARVSLARGDSAKAAEEFLRAENLAAAADAFERAGDAAMAANYRGEIAFKAGRPAEAAAFFHKAEDYGRAAELFEQEEMLAEAAAAYEAGESFAAAAACYLRAGAKDRAAACYEQAGEYETGAKLWEELGDEGRAAELYERAGQTFKSGVAAAKAGQAERAIALLQRVPANDERYAEATERLAELFLAGGMAGLALERLEKALAAPAAAGNLSLRYWLGRAHEAAGQRAPALDAYKAILAVDFAFRDARERLAQLQSAPAPAARAAAPKGPAAAGGRAAVATLQVCPVCGLCYDHTASACTADSSALKVPRVVPFVLLDRYRLVRVLGQGGMGMVFAAHDKRLDRHVAIKVVRREDVGDAKALARLEREARVVAKLNHPGVIGIFDSGELEDGAAFLVMELLDGWDLARLLARHGPGRPAQVASLLRQAAAALGAAHRMGVVHRDVKPQNLVLLGGAHGFQVKVLDFGIAKGQTVDASVTQSGTIVGTPAYMSPEQARNENLDARSDLYSLAMVGYEALTGTRAIADGDILKMLVSVLNDPPPRLSGRLKGAPEEVDSVFAWALAKDPAARPADAETWAESAADLLECMPGDVAGWPEPLPAGIAEPSQAPAPRPRAVVRPAGAAPARPLAPTAVTPAPPRAADAAEAPTVRPAVSAKAPRFSAGAEIGRGPLGVVRRGEDSATKKPVALRALARADAALVADLKAAAGVQHPNVARVLGLVELDGQRFLVTELVEGASLAAAVKGGKRLGVAQALSVGRLAAQALTAIHEKGVAHGSLQPSNLISAGGTLRLTDLGLGRLHLATVKESPYRAPEARLDAAGDLYALGALLFHALAGAPPPGAGAAFAAGSVPNLPAPLEALVRRCLAADPAARPASAAEALAELQAVK